MIVSLLQVMSMGIFKKQVFFTKKNKVKVILGFDENKVYEIHGSINHMQCNSCLNVFKADGFEIPYDPESFEAKEPLPKCKSCKNIIRPNILMFGDYEFDDSRCQIQNRKYHDFLNKLNKKDILVILEFGAGHAVPTIRSFGEQLLLYNNCQTTLVRVNLRDYDGPMFPSALKNKSNNFMAFPDTSLNFMIELNKFLKAAQI